MLQTRILDCDSADELQEKLNTKLENYIRAESK